MMIERLQKELKYGKVFLGFAFLRIIGHGLMFLVPLLLARFFSPEVFGAYSLSIMLVYFFTTLFINSSQKPFIVYASEELAKYGTIRKAFTVRVVLLSLSVFLFSLLSLLLIDPLSSFASITKGQYLFLFFAYIGVGIRYFFEAVFLALNHRLVHVLYDIITGIFSVIFILITYAFFGITLEAVFVMFAVAPVLAAPFCAKWFETQKLFPLSFDRVVFSGMLDYTKWTALGGVSVYFINWGDNLVLRYFVSLKDIGAYNLGYQVFKGTLMLLGAINLYFLPFISQNKDDSSKMSVYLNKKRPRILIAGFVGIVLLALIMPSLFTYLYEDAYKKSIVVTEILLIASLFVLYKTFYTPIFEAFKRYRFTQITDIGMVISNVLLNIIFVALWGMLGAAIATVTTYIGATITYEIYFRKNISSFIANWKDCGQENARVEQYHL